MKPVDERIIDRAAALYVTVPACRLVARKMTERGWPISASTLRRKLKARGVLRSRGEAIAAYRAAFGDPRERGRERRDAEFKALDLFRRGDPLREISRKLGLPYTTVHYWAERSGLLKRRKRRMTPKLRSELRLLRHLSARAAAESLGVPVNTLRGWRSKDPSLRRLRPAQGRSEPET